MLSELNYINMILKDKNNITSIYLTGVICLYLPDASAALWNTIGKFLKYGLRLRGPFIKHCVNAHAIISEQLNLYSFQQIS